MKRADQLRLYRQFLELAQAGEHPAAIARRLGISRTTAWRWARQAPRPIGRPRPETAMPDKLPQPNPELAALAQRVADTILKL